MASLCRIAKSLKTPKFSTQAKSRCRNCGRSRAYMRQFQMCRLCFRKYASLGQIPGVTKSSW